MKTITSTLLVTLLAVQVGFSQQYFPPKGIWKKAQPIELGIINPAVINRYKFMLHIQYLDG